MKFYVFLQTVCCSDRPYITLHYHEIVLCCLCHESVLLSVRFLSLPKTVSNSRERCMINQNAQTSLFFWVLQVSPTHVGFFFFFPPWETCEQLRRNSFASHRMNPCGHSSRIMREVFLFFIIEMLRLTIERKTNEQLESQTGRLFGLLARVHIVYLKNTFSCVEFEDVVFQFHIICNEWRAGKNQGKGERNTVVSEGSINTGFCSIKRDLHPNVLKQFSLAHQLLFYRYFKEAIKVNRQL